MNKASHKFLSLAAIFILVIALFLILLTVSNLIPKKWLEDNMYNAAMEVGEYSSHEDNSPLMNRQYKMDYFTDSLMINHAYYTEPAHPFLSALASPSHGSGIAALVSVAVNPDIEANTTYSRYWHGYLVFLRPLLIFFDYIEIGVFNTFIFFTLFFICLILIYRRLGFWFSFAFLITIISQNILLLPINMQLMSDFLIAFAGIIFVTTVAVRRPEWLKIGFMLIGMCTMFFDFYTYPIITFGLPLIIWLLMLQNREGFKPKDALKETGFAFAAWAAGYLLTWVVKLALVYVFLGDQELGKAFSSCALRLSRELPDATREKLAAFLSTVLPSLSVDAIPLWCISLGLVFLQVFNKVSAVFFGIIVLGAIVLNIARGREKEKTTTAALWIIAALPIVWCCVAVNPTIVHYYFQYRCISVTIMAALSLLFLRLGPKQR